MESLDAKIADLRVKIEIEQKCKDGAENMLHNLKDPSAVQQCELNVRESQRRLDFLSGEMTKLLAKRQNATGVSGSVDEIAASVESFSKSTPGSAMGSGNVAGPVQGQGLGQGQGPGQPQNQFRDWNATANSMWPNGSTDDNSLRPPSLGRMLDKRNSDPGLSITNYYNQMSRTTSPPSISNTSYPSSRMSVAGYPTSSGADRPPLTPEHHTRSTGRLSMTAAMLGNLFHVIGRTRSGSASPRSGSSSASSLPGLVGEAVGQGRDAVTQFDYMKCSTPITSAKVKFKLSEVRHKLDVEQQIRAGTERMKAALVEASQKAGSASTASLDSAGGSGNGDRKMHSEVDEKMAESNAKVALLVKAEQRYRGLYVETEEEAGGANSLRSSDSRSSLTATNDSETGALIPSASSASLSSLHVPIPPARKPLTGRLKLRLVGTSGLPGKKSHRSDTYVVVRIDGVQRAKTKTSKGSKWSEEFDIRVEKGVEVEVAVYEKGGTVLALCWWKMSDLEEELKVSAGARDSMLGKDGLIVGPSAGVLPDGEEAVPGREIVATGGLSDGIETWLDLEPAGQILAKINFVPESPKKPQQKEGLKRRGQVQKVFLKRGHKFVPMQFYQVMKCATCSDFLMTGAGYQCQLCKYTCHKKCQNRVLTKCITKGNEENEKDDTDPTSLPLLKHRIPHRFEPTTTLAASWCCHCGYMLPFGKKQSLKCTECSVTSHKECMHLVPTFCGLSAGMMDQMKSAIEAAERVRRERRAGSLVGDEKEQLQQFQARERERQRREEEQRKQQLQQQQQHLPSSQSQQALQPPQQPVKHPEISNVVPPHRAESVPASLVGGKKPAAAAPAPNIPVATKHTKPESSPAGPSASVKMKVSGPVADKKPRGDSMHVGSGPKGIGLDDFTFLAVLGKGNFGKVMLAEEKFSKSLYAIKVLKKEFIIENDEVESTKSEKRVFITATRERHPFLVNLHSCFQTESRIYFVMEYVSGGDLMWHIQHQQFSEKRAKFYACEVLMALEYFHKNQIVYRDLKLDNILLTLDGHIKLADYGLCKENMSYGSSTSTFCGTPEFMAPEILMEKPYGRAVDWWAFGVLIYEMLLGQSPFRGDDEDEIFEAILEDEILYPVNMAKDAVSLLQKLLTKDPAKRLGGGKSDADEIKKHPFFKGIDWDKLLRLEVTPPYYPTVSGPTDVSNFDEEFTKELPVLTPCHSVLSAADQEEFRGFTHISDWARATRGRAPSVAGK